MKGVPDINVLFRCEALCGTKHQSRNLLISNFDYEQQENNLDRYQKPENADKNINDRGSCLGEYGRRNGEFS